MSSLDATSDFDIAVELAIAKPPLDIGTLVRLAGAVMAGESVAPGTSLAVLVTGDEEVRALNRQFLGFDEPTDVLAFPDDDDQEFVSGYDGPPHLGDIAISLETAARQALEAEHGLASEVSHLLVHGILHLVGYDHVTGPEDETRMREREDHYLRDLGRFHTQPP